MTCQDCITAKFVKNTLPPLGHDASNRPVEPERLHAMQETQGQGTTLYYGNMDPSQKLTHRTG